MAAVERLKQSVRRAELDALIILGDDQKELFHEDHLPSILVYYGDTIRNVPLSHNFKGPEWSRLATARYYEEKEPKDYPVQSGLALHLINSLIDDEFDIASSNGLPPGHGEGHAHAFVRKRLMEDPALPVVPVFLNTYYLGGRGPRTACGREQAERRPPRHRRLRRAQSLRRRRGARPRGYRRIGAQGRRSAAIAAAQEAQLG